MADGSVEEKTATKIELWRERIAEHGRSRQSVTQFCKERGLTECSFYFWRKRLREAGPVRFALIERGPVRPGSALDACVELLLASGELLRIGSGIDSATLRTVLEGAPAPAHEGYRNSSASQYRILMRSRRRLAKNTRCPANRIEIESIAPMIHLPASVRVYLCLTACDN